MKHYLFVYGSLMRNPRTKRLSFLLEMHKAVFIGEACMEGVDLYRLGVKTIIAAEGGSRSYGELYVVSDGCLKTLDRYEGVQRGTFKRHTHITENLLLSVLVPAEVYTWNETIPGLAVKLKDGRYVPEA